MVIVRRRSDKHSRRSRPDRYHGPRFSIEHRGKYTRFETHRSAEDFQAVQQGSASKPELLRGIKVAQRDELAAI